MACASARIFSAERSCASRRSRATSSSASRAASTRVFAGARVRPPKIRPLRESRAALAAEATSKSIREAAGRDDAARGRVKATAYGASRLGDLGDRRHRAQ